MQALCSLEAIHEQLMSLSPIAQPAQVHESLHGGELKQVGL